MDESIKQIVAIVIAVIVGLMLIGIVNSDAFIEKIEGKIGNALDEITYVELQRDDVI